MKLKTSWYKKELGKQSFRQAGWIGLIYFLILFFAIPLDVFIKVGSDNEMFKNNLSNLFEINPDYQLMILFIAPVLLAIFLFRFLQTKNAADFIHGLPIRREKIFYHQFITGLSLLFIPVLAIALLLLIMSQTMNVSPFFTIQDIGYWISVTILLQVFIFVSSVFIGMLTGISALQGVFTYIFLFFPVGIYLLVMSNLNYALIGFPTTYLTETYITEFSVITDSINITLDENITFIKIVLYLVISILLFISSLFIYKKRNVEAATQAIAFRALRPIFKYCFTFCITLIGGLYFGLLQKEIGWIIFGYLIGSIFGYIVAQMILLKTWRVFVKWRGYFYYLIGFAFLFVVIGLDLTGFEKKIPELDEIKSVYLTEDQYLFQYEEIDLEQKGLSSKEEITLVRSLHKQLAQESTRRTDYQEEYGIASNSLSIRYMLNNGKEFVRQYNMDDLDYYQEYLEKIYVLESYKNFTNHLLKLFDEEINRISIDPAYNLNQLNKVEIVDKEQINQAMAALKKDILEESYQEQRHPTYYLAYLDFLIDSKSDQYEYTQIKTNYRHFISWLEDAGLAQQVLMSAEDITKIRIRHFSLYDESVYDPNLYDQESSEIIQIDDLKQIETVLKALSQEYDNDVYGVAIYLKGESEPIIETIDSNHVPDFVLNYFEL